MNKKFSTLMMMALIGAGTLSSSAFAADANEAVAAKINGAALKAVADPATNKTWANGPYFIVADADKDGVAEVGEYVLKVSLVNDKLIYEGFLLVSADNRVEKVNELSWKFAETVTTDQFDASKKTYSYTLTNVETGTLLTAKSDGTLVEVPSDCSHDGETKYTKFTKTPQTEQFKKKDVLGLNIGSRVLPLVIGEDITIGSPTGSNLILCTLETWDMPNAYAVQELNDVKGGAGFNLTFSLDNKNEWANDILSDLNLKAFVVDGDVDKADNQDITWGDNDKFTIPAGVYFASEYPATLNNTNVISNKEDFLATTFLAIDPDVCNTTVAADRKKGIGFGLKTVKGSDMNVYTEQKDDQAAVKGDVYVGNAKFTVVKPDLLGNPEVYNLKAENARLLTDASKTAHVEKTVYLGSLVASNKNYLATASEASKALALKTANTTLYDVTELLKSEDAPSIYTIQFVSELYKDEATNFAGEKNQYLTVGENGLYTVVDIDATDPQYQFVITDVDKEAKTVTFANRQTKASVKVSLYKNEDGSYTVYDANVTGVDTRIYIEKFDNPDVGDNATNGKVIFVDELLQGTKVVLTPVTVEDKFASFVNRADDAGLVTFELAKNVDDEPEFYVGAKREKDGVINTAYKLLAYSSAKNMTQFELIKVYYNDAKKTPWTVTNSYVYKNGSRVLTSTAQDTVAYYKYEIKVFGEENDEYTLNNNFGLVKNAADATDFVIKNNLDGSVSLIPLMNINSPLAQYAYVNTDAEIISGTTAAWISGANYDLASKLSTGLKTFMVGEDPVYSYEAVPQHVSFEAVRGGFLTKDENNDARLAIANVAAEDLTFWLDTVHSDKNIPSFYILKNGAFMYNAQDSVDYYANRGNDRFLIDKESAKLIFKAGELVTSDTLRTTVDGQSVLVAEKDNAPLKIKGGLKNFQFQIVQSEKGSDEYVIRQLNGNYKYVRQVNNYLSLTADKDQAYRFVIEKQAAPTANEGIEVSGVKVIAGNGQITIMGAAGKQVIVSNILGKVVANQMITTDNATIAVPAGIIAVAVEGEAAVKAIVK